ncbi:autophagy protein 13 [Vermiconidia calcicola]|uniref:Autophagy protein 13 n=1 Tax=Vermiconidia calcicola TaxID=1690605 RepID=A0ACC3MD66_9PEZI|nr:autophagy protein 13 [Vermiconidia calcicola]
MHQHPRPSPRTATAAINPATNPERTNNPRDQPPVRTRSSVDLASYTERAGGEAAGTAARNDSTAGGSQDRENTKLNQIVQHFHTKAALMICSSRAHLPQAYAKNGEARQNRWFNVVLDETDVLLDDLQEWRRPDLLQARPPPMVIEVLLDTTHLAHNQALVIVDENGQRREVMEASPSSKDVSPGPTKTGKQYGEVVLERWTVELGDPAGYTSAELNDFLPNVYKKGIVLFRSLYSFARFLPAWKLYRKLGRQTGSHQALRMKFRIRQAEDSAHGHRYNDTLYTPLCPTEHDSDNIVDSHQFQPLLTPAGPLHISLDYRTNCSFGVADSERLLSLLLSDFDQPSAPPAGRSAPGDHSSRYGSSVTSRRDQERPKRALEGYGSLGTFHGAANKRGSPVSDFRRRAELEESNGTAMQRLNAIKDEDTLTGERKDANILSSFSKKTPSPSFKDGPLYVPRTQKARPSPSPSPSTSYGQPESAIAKYASGPGPFPSIPHSRQSSLNALPQQQLRTPPLPNETAVASPTSSSSSRPKYSTSFPNRKRQSYRSGKAAESNTSSGRGSSDSKEKVGALKEGTPGSSGSGRTDSDDIASFISDLERSKDIRFHTPPTNRDNVVNLAKYSSLRDPNAQLAEEMSSSSLFQTSITPPSRRLSNVPGLSTSSSPSRALASHAPHVRSRLSTHSIAEEAASGESSASPRVPEEDEEEDDELPFIFSQDNHETF